MKKEIKNGVEFFMCFFIMFFLLSISPVKAASDFKVWPAKQNIDQNKSWIIKFNSEIKRSSINEKSIYITNGSGQTIPANLQITEDNKSVKISLKQSYKYEAGKTYYLIVTKDVQKVSGKSLFNPVKMQFTIKDETATNSIDKNTVICIDAGRGGNDIGIQGVEKGVREKDVDLNVALKTGEILQGKGIKVVYTRKNDNISWDKDDMKSRFSILNIEEADYVVSIHCNTASNSDANGVETFYKSGDLRGQKLADDIQKKIVANIDIRDRGIKSGNFPELDVVSIPTVKVFLGFLNNREEEKKLGDSQIQNKYAEAISAGIIKFLGTTSSNNSNGSTGQDDIKFISAEDVIHNITEGDNYTLPKTVKVKNKNGQVVDAEITWNNTSINTSKAGTYSYTGNVQGLKGTVNLTLLVTSKGDSRYVVVVDPGHGGYDSGAVGPTGVREKDVTLSVGLKVGNILQSKGVKVVYTRTSDNVSWPSDERKDLQKRVEISDSVKPNYFVSIHCNSADTPSARGTETYYSSGSIAGQKLAEYVQSELIKKLGTYNRGVKTAGYYVVKNTEAPSILAELEFICNPTYEQKLKSDEFQSKAAEAIANGVLKALGK
ncbi:N-acetylmuramoyl-L-alanine amidase [Clostridium tetanomorphum]|uniref:N-acetylmuramoyl-L-alanine amidase n=2 Tax=Clostridium tetanomorphum TaxID=1553 RepID=UPI0004497050|nr:N-acetylmuramoyl-L-alanine amidase [Clostridium tetanomorphum]KAJ49866.1 N-acetylmuramoyl-L-alanine amidase [Clostridium tetanomorphum DSM 665]MBP1866125.1 N-acetylmuramoyl-L-alanine amidase [Clostridium tetanomorphum]NRS86753.1 N-acetylmuramoyl-L-alanine amidase [Clostridium tetanomorphum]